MDRKHAAPVTRAVLAVVPVVTDAGSGNAGQASVTVPVTGSVTPSPEAAGVTGNAGASAAVVPITMPERVGTAVRKLPGTVAQAVRELWLYPDRLIHSLWNGQPESMAAHYRYMTSCAWVPEELSGKKATAVAVAGLAYHILVAWPLLAFANALSGAAPRPLRLLCVAVPVLILILLFVL